MKLSPKPVLPCLAALGFSLLPASPSFAEVTVHPAAPITHFVQIQPIRVKKSDGTTATTFGDTATTTYIQQQINAIWAQLGVRIDWLPFVDYVSDFAYQGSGDYEQQPRPEGDLAIIVDGAPTPPKSANPLVVNMFFVEIVPKYPHEGENTSNGLAFIDSNGIAIHVGSELLTFEAGLDTIAAVSAHEIGHNLGLDHYFASTDNLMNESGGSAEFLTPGQQTTIFTDKNGVDGFDLLQIVPPSNYSQWASANLLQGGPESDDDSDGIKNVIEFMLSLNPKTPSTLPVPVPGQAGLTWTLAKNPAATADGLIYQVQTSTNLLSWLQAGADSSSTIITNDPSTLSVRLNSGNGRRFMRLSVDSSPVSRTAASPFAPAATSPVPRVLPKRESAKFLTPPVSPE